MLEPSALEVEMMIEKLKRDKLLDIDQIPAELIKAGRRTIHSEHHKLLILFGKRRNCLNSGRGQSFCLCKKNYKTGFSKYRGISLFCIGVKLGLSH